MRSQFLTFLLIILCSGKISAAKEVLPYKNDVSIDGINKEWPAHLPKYSSMTDINYAVANDAKNLYLILRIADEVKQKQIAQNGLEIWINKDGKKKKLTGITFPLPIRKGPVTGKETAELILTGFLIDNGKQPVKDCPVKVALTKDQNVMTYELSVPFNTFYKEQLDQDDIDVDFCIGFFIKGTPLSDNDLIGRAMGGDPGMRGQGMGGPGMVFNAENMDRYTWFSTKLAVK
ncbi:MAG: hypothetical protein PHS30_03420 [Bacteroidales bacterium]|nr:hypothetical protein [Bacteroidales bacterium]